MPLAIGACVKIPDGRIGRVREYNNKLWKVRVKRNTSDSHTFMYFTTSELRVVKCPDGWMSVDGYNNYVKKTLKKMRERKKLKN